jgi:hypothetical protein
VADNDVTIELVAEVKDFQAKMAASMKSFVQATSKMDKAAQQFAESTEKSTSFAQQAFATMAGFIGGNLVIGAISKVSDSMKFMFDSVMTDGIKATDDQAKATLQLSIALGNLGQNNKENINSFVSFADELERTTNIADDLTIKMLALAKGTGATDEQAKKLVTTAIDLSAATGKDVNTSFQQLTATLSGSAGRLAQLNPELAGLSKEALESGKAIDLLSEKFQGLAAKSAQTYSGQILNLKNQFGNFAEAIAGTISNSRGISTALGKAAEMFSFLTKYVEENKVAITELINSFVIFSFDLIPKTAGALAFLGNDLKLLAAEFKVLATIAVESMSIIGNAFSGNDDAVRGSIKAITEAGDAYVKTKWEIENLESGLERFQRMATTTAEAVKASTRENDGFTDSILSQNNEVNANIGLKKSLLDLETMRAEAVKSFAEQELKASQDQVAQNNILMASKLAQIEQEIALNDNLNTTIYEKQLEAFDLKIEAMGAQQQIEQQMLDDALAKKMLSQEQYLAANSSMEKRHDAEAKKLAVDRLNFEQSLKQQQLQQVSGFFGNLASLSKTNNKDLQRIGKAAAIAQATIDGVLAVQKAWAQGGAFGAVMAAGVAVATGVNIAKIASTPVGLATGIDEVPGIGTRDNFPALLAPGERVVPRETNVDLKNFLEQMKIGQQQQGGPVAVEIRMNDNIMDFIEAQIIERRRFNFGQGV